MTWASIENGSDHTDSNNHCRRRVTPLHWRIRLLGRKAVEGQEIRQIREAKSPGSIQT